MNGPEFSNEFDLLYNNITSNMAPGLNEYEKSVFLTQAQLEIILNHFNPLGNKYKEGINDSSKRQIEFSQLIKTANIGNGITLVAPRQLIDDRIKTYSLPSDLLLILNEAVFTSKGRTQVVTLDSDEYFRLMNKPYKEPFKNQTWRLIAGGNDLVYAELIPKTGVTITNYAVRYVKAPYPIILESWVGTTTTIGGKNVPLSSTSVCELNSIVHKEILDRAVILAKVAWQGDLKSTIETGIVNE